MTYTDRKTVTRPHKSINFSNGKAINGYHIEKFIKSSSQCEIFSLLNDGNKILKVYYIGEEPDKKLVELLSNSTSSSLPHIYNYGIYSEHFYCIEQKYFELPLFSGLSEKEQVEVVNKEIAAVNALHKIGYLHLDIKKEHFMKDKNGNIVLIDIGYAQRSDNTSFNKDIPAFAAPELYARKCTKESDYFAFGVALLEQYLPELFRSKSRQEIVSFINSKKLIGACSTLKGSMNGMIKVLLSDNPKARTLNVFDDGAAKRVVHREIQSREINRSETATKPIQSKLMTTEEAKEALLYQVYELAHKTEPVIFETKVVTALKKTRFTDVTSIEATESYLRTLPRNTQNVNYTNLSNKNIEKFIENPEVTTKPSRFYYHSPIRFMRHLKMTKKIYTMKKELVNELDKQGSLINKKNEETAWAILKVIGIVIGVIAAIAVAIAVIIAILYILAAILCIIIVGCILAAIFAAMGS